MLHLASETSADWLSRARAQLDALLLDPAHCEKKTAGAALERLFFAEARSCERFPFLAEGLAGLEAEIVVRSCDWVRLHVG